MRSAGWPFSLAQGLRGHHTAVARHVIPPASSSSSSKQTYLLLTLSWRPQVLPLSAFSSAMRTFYGPTTFPGTGRETQRCGILTEKTMKPDSPHPAPSLPRFGQGAFTEMVCALHARMVAEAAAAGHPQLPPLQVRTGCGGGGRELAQVGDN